MNTSVFEANDNLAIAESYYNAMLAKDFDKMAGYLHDNVHFIGPLAEKSVGQVRNPFATRRHFMVYIPL